MDILFKNQNHTHFCQNHSNENATYLKINDFQGSNDQILFCDICIEEIDSFKFSNFLRIKSILLSDNLLVLKYPPLDNKKVMMQMKEIIQEIDKQKNLNTENQITKFFDEITNIILEKIEKHKKSMLALASNVRKQNEIILQKFKEFSQVELIEDILKSITFDQIQKEKELREIINKAQNEKQQNFQQAINMLNEIYLQNNYSQFEIPQGTKESIFNILDQINFFKINKHCNLLPNFNFKNKSFDMHKQEFSKNQNFERLFDDSIKLNYQKNQFLCFDSDFNLKQNKKYVFRFQFKDEQSDEQSDEKSDEQSDELSYEGILKCFYFGIQKQKRSDTIVEDELIGILQCSKDSVDKCQFENLKIIKGNLNDCREIIAELRVDLQNQMVQILDYPNYNHIVSLEDETIKNNLIKNDYRLILFGYGSITAQLKQAFICEQFY